MGVLAVKTGFWGMLELATECAKEIQECLPLVAQLACYG